MGHTQSAESATAAAVAAALGPSATVAPRRPSARPPPSAFECSTALVLIAVSRGWEWTTGGLIRARLLPLLSRHSAGRSALLRLLGRLVALAPGLDDAEARATREQLRAAVRLSSDSVVLQFGVRRAAV